MTNHSTTSRILRTSSSSAAQGSRHRSLQPAAERVGLRAHVHAEPLRRHPGSLGDTCGALTGRLRIFRRGHHGASLATWLSCGAGVGVAASLAAAGQLNAHDVTILAPAFIQGSRSVMGLFLGVANCPKSTGRFMFNSASWPALAMPIRRCASSPTASLSNHNPKADGFSRRLSRFPVLRGECRQVVVNKIFRRSSLAMGASCEKKRRPFGAFFRKRLSQQVPPRQALPWMRTRAAIGTGDPARFYNIKVEISEHAGSFRTYWLPARQDFAQAEQPAALEDAKAKYPAKRRGDGSHEEPRPARARRAPAPAVRKSTRPRPLSKPR